MVFLKRLKETYKSCVEKIIDEDNEEVERALYEATKRKGWNKGWNLEEMDNISTDNNDKLMWNPSKGEYIPMPIEIKLFLKEIENLCRKYNLSINYEDAHDGFIIENFDDSDSYIRWLNNAIDGR